MKRMFLILFCTVFCVANTNNLFALANVNASLEATFSNMDDLCMGRGRECFASLDTEARIDQISINSYRVTIEVKKVTNNLGIELVKDGQYTFPEDSKLRIAECNDYPALVGHQIDVSGKTVAINGIITIQLIIEQQ